MLAIGQQLVTRRATQTLGRVFKMTFECANDRHVVAVVVTGQVTVTTGESLTYPEAHQDVVKSTSQCPRHSPALLIMK